MRAESRFEWPLTLDVPALLDSGWRPIPFREFIVKVHSRCDLSCDYCYMYEMADQSWREQPRVMSPEIAKHAATRIGEHARVHQLPKIDLILHGGEPLLAGPRLIEDIVHATREAAGPGVLVTARIQTNGIGLNDTYLRLFAKLGVQVGVSLDGTAADHDRHRRFASGRGSHAAVSAGLERLRQPPFRHLFNGLLCTIDLRSDPLAAYEALAAYEPPRIDFLLPHGTWAAPPPGRVPGAPDTPYADWLIRVFDHWYGAPATEIRLFADIMHLILGGASSAELVGLAPSRMVVIETNGAIEQADTLKATFHGAGHTGLDVVSDPLDEAGRLPGIVARQLGVDGLSADCQACPIRQVCGGGLYAHRYKPGTGFANPSVYCPDLMRLITHIRTRMGTDIGVLRQKRGQTQ
jgi:uncharacterized protein